MTFKKKSVFALQVITVYTFVCCIQGERLINFIKSFYESRTMKTHNIKNHHVISNIKNPFYISNKYNLNDIVLPLEKNTLTINEKASDDITKRIIKKNSILQGVNVSTEYHSPLAVLLIGICNNTHFRRCVHRIELTSLVIENIP